MSQVIACGMGPENVPVPLKVNSRGELDLSGSSFTFTALTLAVGSATTPSYGFTGVTGVGMYSASNGVAFATGSTVRVFITTAGLIQLNNHVLDLSNGANAQMARVADNSILFGGSSAVAGAATSDTWIRKAVTAFSDNVAKAVLTFTVPNAAHSASFLIRVAGSMGAGGAIGANESTQSATYIVDITRTAGVNAVATIGATYGQPAAASVAGAANVAVTAALSAISGAVGATNTFTVNATIARSGGSGDNHTAVVSCILLNANAAGVTVA